MAQFSKKRTASSNSTQEWFEAFAKRGPYQHKPVDLSLLNQREIEVLKLLCLGNTLKEAATKIISSKGLPMSRFTVGDYEIAIHAKLHVKTRAQMVNAALAAGVVKPIEGSDLDVLIKKYSTLSKREHDLFEQIAGGKTVDDAGIALCMSIHTSRDYKKKIYEKLEVTNIADATRSFVSLKLEADKLIAAKRAALEKRTSVVAEIPQPSAEAASIFAPTAVVHSVTRELPELSAVAAAAARSTTHPLKIGASYNREGLEMAGRRT